MWYLYVVRCADNSLYCGITTNLERRVKQHNGKLSGGAKYTRGRRPVELLACKTMESRSDASKAEWTFKQLRKPEKLIEISKWVVNPGEISKAD